jgi:hypothetical protein
VSRLGLTGGLGVRYLHSWRRARLIVEEVFIIFLIKLIV